MASSLPSFRYLTMPSAKQSTRPAMPIRAQGCRDEGRSGIDANLSILRERIEAVRITERMERCWRSENGWNYATGYDCKHKRSMASSQFLEIFGLVVGSFGLTIVTGTLCLCLASLLIQLNQ